MMTSHIASLRAWIRPTMALCMALLVLGLNPAKGSLINYTVSQDANNHYIDVSFTSPFTAGGPNVDSAELFFAPLFDSLWSLPWNQSAYASLAAMVDGGVSAQIRSKSAVGDDFAVTSGWMSSLSVSGVSLSNNGIAYDIWHPQGQSNPNSGDTLYARLRLSNSLLDGNGNGWSQADVDAGVDAFLTFQTASSVIGSASDVGAFTTYEVQGNAPWPPSFPSREPSC